MRDSVPICHGPWTGLSEGWNGKPIAELRPHRKVRVKSLIGLDEGTVQILGDIVGPISNDQWEAEQ